MSAKSMTWTCRESWQTSLYVPLVPRSTAPACCIHYSSLERFFLPQQVDFGGGILGLCESPNHEAFSLASQGLFERLPDGGFIFDRPLHITAADAKSMVQEEYNRRFFFGALFAVVRAPERPLRTRRTIVA